MTDIRLYIVCDDAAAGALRVMQCLPGALPGWARVLTEPKQIAAMPDGARCIGTFTRRGDQMSAAELSWWERRRRGGISAGLTAKEIDGLGAFIANRKAEHAVSLGALVVEDLESVDRSPPPALPSSSPPPAKPLASRWI